MLECDLSYYKAFFVLLIALFFKKFFLCVCFYLFFEGERERQSMSEGGAEREGDTESEAGARL